MHTLTEILLADGSNLKIGDGEIVLARYEPGQPDRVLTDRDARDLVLAQPAYYRQQGLETLRAIDSAHRFELAMGADDVVDPEVEAYYPVDLDAVYAGATDLAIAA